MPSGSNLSFLAAATAALELPPLCSLLTAARANPASLVVDRANVSSYDYSAVLYLNMQGESFEGGDFAFVDEAVSAAVSARPVRGYASDLSLLCTLHEPKPAPLPLDASQEDQIVQPRRGRCVLFASGFEHLHRVGRVVSGSRFVLACWFTLSASAGEALLPACYEMGRIE